jgi:hypothetical protein
MLLRKFNAAVSLALFIFVVKCHGEGGSNAKSPVSALECMYVNVCVLYMAAASWLLLRVKILFCACVWYVNQSLTLPLPLLYSFLPTIIRTIR